MTRLYNSLKKLQKGKKLPLIELVNTNKIPVNINNLITDKSVIYFWSKNSKNSYKYSHDKVKELKEAYPNIRIVTDIHEPSQALPLSDVVDVIFKLL